MSNLKFVETMNVIYDEILNLKLNPGDDIMYNNILNKLLELDNLIKNNQVPKDVYNKVILFHDKCHYEIEKLRLNVGQKKKI